ncbi:neuropeptide-like precursor 1 isoform X2 [Calliopsis andreniformis]|uniref:neuropeptide-like precursor 1 isoform X2 n=1 Tax=Calliopsis andreniformis TaxID=337506 RepID=UPI003FCE6F55
MDPVKNYLASFLLYAIIFNQACLLLVTCQEEEISCIPRNTFATLLRQSEMSSNLAAYLRTTRIIENARALDDIEQSRVLLDSSGDSEICLPTRVYLQLLKYPTLRGRFNVNGRTQQLSDSVGRFLDDSMDSQIASQKRSISTLAKNDDLPINIHDRLHHNQDNQDKREEGEGHMPGMSELYLVPNDQVYKEMGQSFAMEKRNVGSLARDFALPPGRRNIATLVYEVQNRGNIQNSRMIPLSARVGEYQQSKRSATFPRNSVWPMKKGLPVPPNLMLKTLSRQGRSVRSELNTVNNFLNHYEPKNLGKMHKESSASERKNDSTEKVHFNNTVTKRQIEFSGNYPVTQSRDFDYEEMIEALANQYQNAEKRFLGRIPQMGPRPTTPSTRRQGR